jgi:hypothetical protein
MRPHGSFSDFVRKSSCPCAAARPRRIEVAASSVQASQHDASESRSLTKATRLRRPLWGQKRKWLERQVRSTLKSRHRQVTPACPKSANNGLMHRSKRTLLGSPRHPSEPTGIARRNLRCWTATVGEVLPKNAIAKTGGQATERKIRYQNQQQ